MAEERYTVGAMTVTLTVENGVPVDGDCECERQAKLSESPFIPSSDKRCKHIREAEMYHHYSRKVEPINSD
ncbi:hypothetical protein DVK02_08980 [Halobellus sp. Atlit-31R]|nr:hypothetical protein DVK02_08980 [Halobellus sp. Atlit-31R]